MSESFYVCRGGIGNWSYLSNNHGWCKNLADAKAFINRDAALTVLNVRPGSIWSESELKASPYYQAEMKSTSPKKAAKLEVLPPVKVALNATLKTGNDAATAKQLNKLFAEAQNGMRRIVALGLFAWEVKETQLKHGEFGKWLLQHCPKLATVEESTGKVLASRALRGYMELTKGVLESCGVASIEKYLGSAAKFAHDANLKPGQFLLLADKKVPDDLKPLREKIFELVDGKTQRALFMEFKQSNDDDDQPKPKVGRSKGSSGLTKEMRELAAQHEEEERLNNLEQETKDTTDWLLKHADAKNLGMMDSKLLAKLQAANQTVSGFITRLLESRKGGGN
jgi:hypothetical protein